ncbi:uncharacterized protein [Palaemon carinicauda]|uniref:uncharacterized protein n=1 Tax=Palaemon carinicauda TaxID=392227 RepID=UPI0035B6384F
MKKLTEPETRIMTSLRPLSYSGLETAALDVLHIYNNCTPKYLKTYKSGGQESQIDFALGRRVYLKEKRNCKIFLREAVTPQHRLLTVYWARKRTIRGRQEMIPKIRWWKLKEPEYRDRFIERILVELGTWNYEDVDEWWERNSSMLKRVGREVLGMSTGKGPRDKETLQRKDDIILCDETTEGFDRKLERWREELESRGLKISRTKTE